MRIPRETIEAIRERVSIVDVVGRSVTLRRKGNSLMGLCPFHQEKSPSFSVVPAKGIYHCFGCGEGGDIFAFVQKSRGLSFTEVVKELAEEAGVTFVERKLTPEEQRRLRARAGLHEICQLAGEYFHNVLLTRSEGSEALTYIRDRAVTDESIQTFRLGYAPDSWDGLLNHLHTQGVTVEQAVAAGLARWREPGNPRRGAYDLFRDRIIVPIFDRRSRPIAFGGRILTDREGAPKYVNSPETDIYKKSRTLYGLSHALPALQKKNRVLVVEGYFDVIALHQAGFPETVATCGTALTEQHLHAIRTLTNTVITVFDADEAGKRAAERSLPLFFGAGIEPRRLMVTGAKDPDEYIQTFGANAFDDLLSRSEPLYEVVVRQISQRHGPTPGGRQRTVDELADVLRRLQGASLDAHVERTATMLRVSARSVREKLGRLSTPPPVRPPPSRWNPSPRLRTLLWLMLHYPSEVADELLAFPHPQWLTENTEALRAIGMLLQGSGLPEVMETITDVDVARVLRIEATRDLNYKQDQARNEVLSFLRNLQIQNLDRKLFELQQEIEASFAVGTVPKTQLTKRKHIQHQLHALRQGKSWKITEQTANTETPTTEEEG